ncbi:MAG: hypothetical protein MRJ93_10310 [Nitrososphaeraceae archaeon]|nr:hypothetical protein [Nitrososphaeraceae archaeon]
MKKEVTYPFGTGFRDLDPAKYTRKRISAFIIDETVIQIGNNISGYGYVLNQ